MVTMGHIKQAVMLYYHLQPHNGTMKRDKGVQQRLGTRQKDCTVQDKQQRARLFMPAWSLSDHLTEHILSVCINASVKRDGVDHSCCTVAKARNRNYMQQK